MLVATLRRPVASLHSSPMATPAHWTPAISDDAVTKIVLRKATASTSARLGFPNGSIAGIAILASSAAKCRVGVSHDGFATQAAANRSKVFWRAALARLTEKISA
jgi:hypothetical protein